MDRERLMNILESHIKDKWLLWLCKVTINRPPGDKGIALGLASSNILGHIYHAHIDWYFLTKKIRRYYRFCDDKFIISKDKEFLKNIAKELINLTKENGQDIKANWLIINPSKSSFRCLGSILTNTTMLLPKETKKRIEKRLHNLNSFYYLTNKNVNSWNGTLGAIHNLHNHNILNFWRIKYENFFNRYSKYQAKYFTKNKRTW